MRYIPVIFGVVLFIYGLIDCLRSDPADVRSIPKPAWILVILLLPLVGVILWFFFGRPRYSNAAASPMSGRAGAGPRGPSYSGRPNQYVAPDDDPEFLRNLQLSQAQKAEAERLRKLKAELDAREAKIRADEAREEKLRADKHREEHPNDETKH
ncbi:hypothetical protein AL755_19855 [Arthrobacter sp. ERGS1:01]|uniref:cell envelope integrity protein TolA n=1 Tax=Arthrobacter sp. ERGS1:01 TaxID=1704044 RepID=UPI0006CB7D48|nr:cell envelope integrity protein TolA [Arthrobacter sp. ERGS1:01]ALE07208.1 hypothetical protein AL755_19855 [Arthrobacter sp. ERGS1:01]